MPSANRVGPQATSRFAERLDARRRFRTTDRAIDVLPQPRGLPARGLDPAGDLAEGDPAAVGAGSAVAEHDLGTVGEERRLVAPADLQERPALVRARSADRPGPVEVAGAEGGAVDG